MKGARPQGAPGGFSVAQLKLLHRDLDPNRVSHRQTADGIQIAYIEGWFAIAEANAVFGHSGWDREIVHFERLFEQRRSEEINCGYVVRVKITVVAGGRRTVREGTGFGQAKASNSGDAHEKAIKVAETDATKRALSTFGKRFGLNLYGKDTLSNGDALTTEKLKRSTDENKQGNPHGPLFLLSPEGNCIGQDLSPEAFCSGLRQVIAKCVIAEELASLSRRNHEGLLAIASLGLKSSRGVLYSDILKSMIQERETQIGIQQEGGSKSSVHESADNVRVAFRAENSSGDSPISRPIVPPPASLPIANLSTAGENYAAAPARKVDKSKLVIGIEKRRRDKNHLRTVAQMPCLVCNRQPTHAHHLKFAQKHGMSQKVSDEYVVPLCALHHSDLHRASKEENWWQAQHIEPLPMALALWARRETTSDEG